MGAAFGAGDTGFCIVIHPYYCAPSVKTNPF